MTRKIMGLTEIENHFKDVKSSVFSRKGSMMYLASDIDSSIAFIEAENVVWALEKVKAAGGTINVERKKRRTEQEFRNAVAEKIRAFGATAPQGTQARELAAFVP